MPKNVLKNGWIMRMTMAMQITHPDVSKDKIEACVAKIYEKRVKDTNVQLYNSYENTVTNASLLQLPDWFQTRKPLIAESGVYFYPKDQKRNVNVEIIKDDMLDARTIHKGEKFKARIAGDVFLEAVKDSQQANDKKAANSGYGAEGESSSFLYNINSAMSVTACGRGQISTACQCFENLWADNVKFFHMTEFYEFVWNIIHERPNWKFDTDDIIPVTPSRKQFIKRFLPKFGHIDIANADEIGQTYDYLDDEQRKRVYYNSNFRLFITNNRRPNDLYNKIISTGCEFVNPNKPPEEIQAPLNKLVEMIVEFVGYRHGVFRYEDRTRYQKRAVAVVIDTDSTFIAYYSLYKFLTNGVLVGKMFRNRQDEETYKLRVLNVLACASTAMIKRRLWDYTGVANVAEDERHYVNMKNEFDNSRMIITYAMKSYIALQRRQEDVVFDEPNLDVKGVNFFKSTASEDTSKFIYDKILMGQLLDPPSGKISLRDTYREINKFQQNMTKEIKSGNMGYLKRSIRVKTEDGYANPMRIGQYKAVYCWNKIVSDKHKIKLPATVTLVKVMLRNKQDAAALENWPEIYNKVIDLFDHDADVGDYIDKATGKIVKGKGIKAIAIPTDYDEVPEWLLAIIDVDTLVSDNMALFTQLNRPLGLSKATVSHNGASSVYYTNIVRI